MVLKKDKIFNNKIVSSKLSNKAINSGIITITQQIVMIILQTARTMVLARVLSPNDFGLIAMVTVVIEIVNVFKASGLSTATIQKESINEKEISNLFWINVLISVVLGSLIMVSAPLVALFYDETQLKNITIVLGAAFIVSGAVIQHQALLRRNMMFKSLAIIRIASFTISTIVAIILAISGYNYWALILATVLNSLLTVLFTYIACPWIPGFIDKETNVREMLYSGIHMTIFDIVNYFAKNLDNILIGKVCGSEVLGLYSKAYQIVSRPIATIRNPINNVALSVMSKITSDKKRFRNYFYYETMILAIISIPLIVYMFINSYDIILLLFGSKWLYMERIFRLLTLAGLFQTCIGIKGPVFIAYGKTKEYLKLGIIGPIILVICFSIGVNWGAEGVALSYVVGYYLTQIPQYIFLHKNTCIKPSDTLQALYPTVIAAFIAAAINFLLLNFIIEYNFILRLIISFVCNYSVYITIMFIIPLGRKQVRYVLRVVIKKIKHKLKS